MFGGYPDDNGGGGGFGGSVLNHLAGQLSGGVGYGGHAFARPPASAYDDYFRAYSVALLPGRERPELSYGGKIIMPPSALAKLTSLEIESPWIFELSAPQKRGVKTHAGVLEFIAEEGQVHLPAWMMRTLALNEGDPIRIKGSRLPKGKLVKLQAQTADFLEISDHKTVLEKALRNFSTLTKGDIIEILHNCITFEILVMDIQPEGDAIFIVDTDLEVDFATPKGYVEPTPVPRAPPSTMASKLNIDTASTEATPVPSRPGSTAPDFEAFRGGGQTLGGRRTKGKGKAKKIDDVDEHSKIIRTDKVLQVTAETLDDGRKVPAALNLPFGKLFFGYQVAPLGGHPTEAPAAPEAFSGSGVTMSGRRARPRSPPPASASEPAPEPAPSSGPVPGVPKPAQQEETNGDPWARLGSGNSLTARSAAPSRPTGSGSGSGGGTGRKGGGEVIDIDSD